MTRPLCPRSSKRKPSNLSQEIQKAQTKENVPTPLQKTRVTTKNKKLTSIKENLSPDIYNRTSQKLNHVKSCNRPLSPIRKSARKPKSFKGSNISVNVNTDRNVLCDKTNTSFLNLPSPPGQSFEIPVLKTVENKNQVIQRLISLPKPNNDFKRENHVPIYKTGEIREVDQKNRTLPVQKKEAVYEFECEENEESVPKKKRKKRVYKRKPKIGPKALTINNIKYSSSESLSSLCDKPIARNKPIKISKSNFKSSVTSLTSAEDNSSSINSFVSHIPLTFCDNKVPSQKRELSVLVESQSELTRSHISYGNHEGSLLQQPVSTSVVSRDSEPTSQDTSSNNVCPDYLKTTSIYQASQCATNTSASSHHFLSSTPCKRTSTVVCNNSVFDDSRDLPNIMRQSPGYIDKSLTPNKNSLANCFGFEETEELEEPLISPIKNNIEPKSKVKQRPIQTLQQSGRSSIKPSAQEVIEMLKASIPKEIPKQGASEIYDIELENFENSHLLNPSEEIVEINYKKPPRRSYERQRRIRQNSVAEDEHEEEGEGGCNEVNIDQEVKKKQEQKGNKCYKKTANRSKSAKPPKVTKAKKRIAKEEEEMERLAAMMNAQFQEIEKVSLVIE